MSGRLAIVTGAASGMGRGTALALADDGYALGLVDRAADALSTVADELAARGVPVRVAAADVADAAAVEAAVDDLCGALGTPWLLAAAAGVLEGGEALTVPPEHFARVMAVNYLGVVHADTAVARRMVAGGAGGRIVNWSSNNAVGGTARFSAYAASKAAVDAFTRSLAVELGPHGITVNSILPGSVRTPMLAHLSAEAVQAETLRIPAGRWGEPADVAAVVRFLAGDDASWVTGVTLPVDGGTLANHGRSR